MNRRSLLKSFIPPGGDEKIKQVEAETNPFANQELPETIRSRAGLSPYTGDWTNQEASHLLRRSTFGATVQQIQRAVTLGMNATLDQLFATKPLPSPPINYGYGEDPAVEVGESWIEAAVSQGVNGRRRRSLTGWTIGLLLQDGISIREKMTLFWHNHFVIEIAVVNDPRAVYRYINLLRENALGNFKHLVNEITIDPAMLFYLNGNQNVVGAANENYARELLELFSIGKGPAIGPGNYTHYTEQDVLAAAKVLTGWVINGNRRGGAPEALFQAERHDTSDKEFSEAFGNQVISNNGADEYKDLVDMIFGQRETARFICRKLYRWFVYYVIDSAAEQNIIEPMAQMLIDHNFEIAPVVRALLSSEHFYDHINQGCVIKNPLDFTISLIRQFEVAMPDAADYEIAYRFWILLGNAAGLQQMAYYSPPNVAGWAAYHQEPQYYETWINSVTLPTRATITDALIGRGINLGGNRIGINPFVLLSKVSNPADPNVVIQAFVRLLFPQPITENQQDFLKNIMLPGLPDFEWSEELNAYLTDPNNRDKRMAVENKLRVLLKTMMNMAEYHLS